MDNYIESNQKHWPTSHEIWALISNTVLTSYLTLGKTLNLLGFQFVHLQNECFDLDDTWSVFNSSHSKMP